MTGGRSILSAPGVVIVLVGVTLTFPNLAVVGSQEMDEETRRMIDEGLEAWDDPVPIKQLLHPEH